MRAPAAKAPRRNLSTPTLLRHLWRALSPQRRAQFLHLSVVLVLCSAAELLTLIALQRFLVLAASSSSPAADSSPFSLLALGAMWVIVGAIVAGLGRLYTLRFHDRWALDVACDFSVRLFEGALRQRYSDHVHNETAELFAALEKTQILVNGVLAPLAQAFVSACLALAIFAYAATIAPVITLCGALLLAALYGVIALASRSRLRVNSLGIAELAEFRMKAAQEAQSGFREIVLARAQGTVVEHFERSERAYRRGQAEARFFSAAPRHVVEPILLIAICALALFWSARPGGLAAMIPIAGALALAAQRLVPLLHHAYLAWGQFVGNSAVLADVLTLMSRPGLPMADRDVAPLAFARDIVFDGVSLSYPGRGEVLRGLDLRIAKGARIGIVGATGSGKSSLLDLLLGLIEPDAGSIRVDGLALDTPERRSAWMAAVAFVPQAIYLPDWPLSEVIAFPQRVEDIDPERMRAAVADAQLSDFIASLPAGLETRPGASGVRLSGGQRQRIALARALYRRAQVLVLDEATGQLDPDTEHAVLETLRRIDPEVTIIVVTHRASALRDCDVVLRIEAGRIQALSAVATPERDPV